MSLSAHPQMMDVNQMLQGASTPFSVTQLVQSGIQRLRVISPEKMDEMINSSVRTIIDKYRFMSSSGNAPALQQMEKESKADFKELLNQYQQTAEVTSAVERSKQALAQDFEQARFELEPEKPSFEKGGESREAWVLRRRIEKLTEHVATMEAALKTLSSAKAFSSQHVQNILRDLGLAQEDKQFEKKKEMLRVVLSENQVLRQKARELAARGITLAAPQGVADALESSSRPRRSA